MQALLLSIVLLAAPAEPPSVAMALKVKGNVTATSGEGKPARLWVMDTLKPGDRLTVPPGGELTLVFLEDGHKEVLAAGKTATVAASGCSPADAVIRQEPGQLNRKNLSNLRDDVASGRLGGVLLRKGEEGKPVPVLTPLPGATVLTDRPQLSWPPVEGAQCYIVELFTGPDTKDLTRLLRVETKENHLAFPALGPYLHRWSVTARFEGGKEREVVGLREAHFAVATPREVRTLESLLSLTKSDDPADLLLAAGTYESRGALHEALGLYERLAKLLPGEARIHDTLANYYEAGGRPEQAKAEREKARELRQNAQK